MKTLSARHEHAKSLFAPLGPTYDHYASLLSLLQATFSLGDQADGRVMQRSIRSMHQMDALNQQLAARGLFPRFTLPAFVHQLTPAFMANLDESENKLKGIEERIAAHAPTDHIATTAVSCLHAYLAALGEVREAMRAHGDAGVKRKR